MVSKNRTLFFRKYRILLPDKQGVQQNRNVPILTKILVKLSTQNKYV